MSDQQADHHVDEQTSGGAGRSTSTHSPSGELAIDFAGEWHTVRPGTVFSIGRDADLSVDDNPFLHRQLLRLSHQNGIWFLSNVGSRLSVTVTDTAGRVQSWLAPGASLPIVFEQTTVVFTAGPTSYELLIHAVEPAYRETHPASSIGGDTTMGSVELTDSQRLLILALAEPMLMREGSGRADIPTNIAAAARLGWGTTRFNRKLDNVCDKLEKHGVQGLKGEARSYATNRRARLVEFAVGSRLVTRHELGLLAAEHAANAENTASAAAARSA